MWIWLGLAIGWVWLRRRQGLPILPAFLGADPFKNGAIGADPFKNGAILVPTKEGVMAVPADTPVIHPAVASSAGLLSQGATANLAQALAASKTVNLGGLLDPNTGNTTDPGVHAPRTRR